MPVTCQYEKNNQGVIITAVGTVDGDDFVNKIVELFSDGETIRNYKYRLNDFT